MQPVVASRRIDCRSSREALWPRLADTDRTNRAIGMSRLQIEPLDGAAAARFLVRTTLDGFAVEYEEQPFEWVELERFGVERRLRKGPISRLAFRAELSPRPGGTSVLLTVELTPRSPLLWPVVKLSAGRALAGIAREIATIDRELATADATPPPPASPPAPLPLERARAALRALVGPDGHARAERLAELVATGPDHDLSRMRPFELAEALELSPERALDLCLQATIAGLLELRWELICPSCRTGAEAASSLNVLPEGGHCQLCDLAIDVDLAKAVEATFRPAPGLRAVDVGPYCIGGPARTPHVIAQLVLPAQGRVTLAAPDRPGRYRLFVRGGATARLEVSEAGEPTLEVRYGGDLPAELHARPGAPIEVISTALDERHVKLERLEWASLAATAHHVSLSPVFRRFFATEVLRPGVALKIGRVTLLFTDLTGSTALYAREGDAAAFQVVQLHFDVLRAAIEAHRGSIIKTIGDAVMAAFEHEHDALAAGLDMLRAWPAFEAANAYARGTKLKIGLFGGPCYAVTANGLLDYFGQTVNVAARLQGQAEADEIVVPAAVADAALPAGAVVTERWSAALKGVDEKLPAARISLAR